MERLRSNGWTLLAIVEEVGSNPTRSFFFHSLIFFRKEKTNEDDCEEDMESKLPCVKTDRRGGLYSYRR